MNHVTVDLIQRKVAEHYNLSVADLNSKRRFIRITFPRQVALYLSRILTGYSFHRISHEFNLRSHGTVIYACQMMEIAMRQDVSVKHNVDYLAHQIRTYPY